jgi:hypothetical protein
MRAAPCQRRRVRASRWREESGQSAVEWTGLVLLVMVLCVALVAARARVPGAGLARSIAGRILCAIDLSHACTRDPELVAFYGSEVAGLIRAHAPAIAYEIGTHAMPVDFRDCRATSCGDGPGSGVVWRTDAGRQVTLFVHVVDCRAAHAEATVASGGDCSGERAGRLYIQYFTYYADSATYRGVPVAGDAGFHRDDWEGYQVRINPDGSADARASSHNGYNYGLGKGNWAADAGIEEVSDAEEDIGLRERNGWGPETGWLFVSGGSHAGHAKGGDENIQRVTPRGREALVSGEQVAAVEGTHPHLFAISPPWQKQIWRDPEAEGTD